MSSISLLRIAVRGRPVKSSFFRSQTRLPTKVTIGCANARTFSKTAVRPSGDPHGEETFEEFTVRYEKEFEGVNDVFELQRNLNNAFAYDLVPSPSVITAALKAARRVNDFPTAVRIFEGIKAKVENKGQYDEYLKELEPIREELGINLKEVLYPESS
ncbi:cytochrome c oxidase polypeptide VI [Patellaria atrata CBS 101060]|uniref:Cytochrome c oxidase subunit 6, mitochondrial n=1 Tax=Patellaria atrata CBS 101060 TaxID=1346257 RepID=A0A9P4VPW7_9PEZI|nr:cytochrome c oxidase polypeptide VI [Patellaria atrata CBS 101060]